jgi:hypothetical protein
MIQTPRAQRRSQYGLGYDGAIEDAEAMTDTEIRKAGLRAASLINPNYERGKIIAASLYEGKAAGFRYALNSRRG